MIVSLLTGSNVKFCVMGFCRKSVYVISPVIRMADANLIPIKFVSYDSFIIFSFVANLEIVRKVTFRRFPINKFFHCTPSLFYIVFVFLETFSIILFLLSVYFSVKYRCTSVSLIAQCCILLIQHLFSSFSYIAYL